MLHEMLSVLLTAVLAFVTRFSPDAYVDTTDHLINTDKKISASGDPSSNDELNLMADT